MNNFKKLSVILIAVMAVMFSCSKEDVTNEKEKIPEGWETEKQIVVIDGQGYNAKVAFNPESDEMFYVNPAKEIEAFFSAYDETFVPHIVYEEKGLITYFYKDWEDFESKVKMQPSSQDASVANKYNGGKSISYQHSNYGGLTLHQYLFTFKGFEFGNSQGYGQSNSYVGSSMNDEITDVVLKRYSYSDTEPIHYMGCQHANWGGRRFVLTLKKQYVQEYKFRLTHVAYTRWGNGTGTSEQYGVSYGRNWNDRVSSCETWQAYYNSSHWNNPSIN